MPDIICGKYQSQNQIGIKKIRKKRIDTIIYFISILSRKEKKTNKILSMSVSILHVLFYEQK